MAIRRITILGSGTMGHGIAQVSASAGYNVTLRDIKQSFLDNAMGKIRWSLGKMVAKNRITDGEAAEILARIRPELDLASAVRDADLIIEAVPEIMDLKKKVYGELNEVASGDTIFASNTSTLPITEVAGTTTRPGRFIGIHFFNPPQLMKLVEIIPGTETEPRVVEITNEYVRSIRKEPVLCRKDVPGFIVNRLFIPLAHEACHAMDRHGYSPEEVDSAAKFRLGFPMGILELSDFTGIDVMHKATVEMHSRDKSSINPHEMMGRLFDGGKLGKKSGEGFYKYSGEEYERIPLSEELAAKVDLVHLAAGLTNSAAWLVTNGVSNIREIELAARLGLGLKTPLFETAERIGIGAIAGELRRLARSSGEYYTPDPLLESMR